MVRELKETILLLRTIPSVAVALFVLSVVAMVFQNYALYPHMSDYNENLGYCSDSEHAYYANAKAKFNGMTATARERFVSESEFADAYARLQAWATINGDNVTSGGISSLGRKIMPLAEEASYTGLIIVMSVSAFLNLFSVYP